MVNEFGIEKKESYLERTYRGKWVVVHLRGVQSTYAGKVSTIQEGYLILDPHQSGNYGDLGELEMCVVDGPEALNISGDGLASISSITEQSLRNHCKFRNIQAKKEAEMVAANGSTEKKELK